MRFGAISMFAVLWLVGWHQGDGRPQRRGRQHGQQHGQQREHQRPRRRRDRHRRERRIWPRALQAGRPADGPLVRRGQPLRPRDRRRLRLLHDVARGQLRVQRREARRQGRRAGGRRESRTPAGGDRRGRHERLLVGRPREPVLPACGPRLCDGRDAEGRWGTDDVPLPDSRSTADIALDGTDVYWASADMDSFAAPRRRATNRRSCSRAQIRRSPSR